MLLLFFFTGFSASFHKLINRRCILSVLNYTGTDDLHYKLSTVDIAHKLLMRLALSLPKSTWARIAWFLAVDLEGLLLQLLLCGHLSVCLLTNKPSAFRVGTVLALDHTELLLHPSHALPSRREEGIPLLIAKSSFSSKHQDSNSKTVPVLLRSCVTSVGEDKLYNRHCRTEDSLRV